MAATQPATPHATRRLLVATTNPGKLREFADLLRPLGYECVQLRDLPSVPEPDETGATFLANATLKAAAYANAHRLYTLADDSGLEVDALGGEPGVHSAYYAQRNGIDTPPDRAHRDPANNTLLLQKLQGVPDDRRTARFVCVLAVADPGGRILLTARGTVEGRILHEPRGRNGFGYDPLFFVPNLGKSAAELAPEEKHAVSHRGNAARTLIELLQRTPLPAV